MSRFAHILPDESRPEPDPHVAELRRNHREGAAMLANDARVRHLFAALRARYRAEWEESSPEDIDARERAYRAMRALEDFRRLLTEVASTGRMPPEDAPASR